MNNVFLYVTEMPILKYFKLESNFFLNLNVPRETILLLIENNSNLIEIYLKTILMTPDDAKKLCDRLPKLQKITFFASTFNFIKFINENPSWECTEMAISNPNIMCIRMIKKR